MNAVAFGLLVVVTVLAVTAWLPAAPQVAAEIRGVAWTALLAPVLLAGVLAGGLLAAGSPAVDRGTARSSMVVRVAGAAAVMAGAVLPAVAGTMAWLLVGRLMLGAGLGIVLTLLGRAGGVARRGGRSLAVLALGAAGAGPVLGGVLTAGPGWRWLSALVVLAGPGVLASLRRSGGTTAPRPETGPPGPARPAPPRPGPAYRRALVVLIVGVLAVIVGLGWPGPLLTIPRLVLIGLGLAVFAVVGWAETHYGRVLPVPLRGPDRPGWRAVAAILAAAEVGGAVTVLPFFHLDVQHTGPVRSGALLALLAAAGCAGAVLSQTWRRVGFGRRRLRERPVGAATVALAVLLVGAVGVLSGLRTSTGVLTMTWASALIGLLAGMLLAWLRRSTPAGPARWAGPAGIAVGVAAGSALAGRVFGEEATGALPPRLQQLWTNLAVPDRAARQPELALAVTHGVTTSLVAVAVVALLGVAATVLARPGTAARSPAGRSVRQGDPVADHHDQPIPGQ